MSVPNPSVFKDALRACSNEMLSRAEKFRAHHNCAGRSPPSEKQRKTPPTDGERYSRRAA